MDLGEAAPHQHLHINIQEALAAEKFYKQLASPSHGLPKALSKAGSTLVAGCLYVSHHFGPSRLLPADHPTRDNDFPTPTRSFLSPTASMTELLHLAKVSGLSRWASNWARLFLMVYGCSRDWTLGSHSWRYAHVNFKRYPFRA